MKSVTVESLVSAPLERVFEVHTDLASAAERLPDVLSLEILSEGPFGVGTRWRETRMMFKKEATEEMWVTACDPPNGYTVEAESHGMHYTTRFSFTPDGHGTRVRCTFSGEARTLGTKLMSPVFGVLMKGTVEKCLRRDLEAMREVCEAGA